MSERKHKRRKTTIGGAFAPRLIEMISSPPFCVLSLSARRVLDRLEIEMASHGGTNNGKLPVTFADFHRYGIDYDAIAPAIREVVALGFVEITRVGRAGNAEYRSPNIFRLTYRHTDYDNPTDEWRRITGDEQAKKIAVEARKAINKNYNSSRGKPGVSVGENLVAPVGETQTTVSPWKPRLLTISPSGTRTAVKARVARPSKGAVASGPVCDVRSDFAQSRVASKLGPDGWSILQHVSQDSLDKLVTLERRGKLDAAALEAARLECRRGAA
jgi:hypothetical protein